MSRIKPEYIWVPLLSALIATVSCWFVASQFTSWPQYEAVSTVLITETPDSEGVGMSVQGITIAQNTLAALAVRDPLVGDVIDKTGVKLTSEELGERIRVRSPEDAPLVEVRLTDADPQFAADMVNAVVEEMEATESPLVNAEVLTPAIRPPSPTLNSYILLLVAAVVGGQIGFGVLAGSRRLASRVRDVEDVQERTDFPLLGRLDLRGAEGDVASSTDRVVATAFASSLERSSRPLMIMAINEATQLEDVLALMHDVLSKLRGKESVLQDAVRRLGPIFVSGDSPLSDFVVTTSAHGSEDETHELSHWLEITRKETDPGGSKQSDERSTVEATDQIHLVQCPPLLDNLEIALSVAEVSKVVLLVQRDVTKLKDFELALNVLNRSGTYVLGVFLVG